MRPNRRKSALAATAVIAGWFATAAQGLHMVSSCKELATIPTPMKDDTHVMVTANILCSRVSAAYDCVSAANRTVVTPEVPE